MRSKGRSGSGSDGRTVNVEMGFIEKPRFRYCLSRVYSLGLWCEHGHLVRRIVEYAQVPHTPVVGLTPGDGHSVGPFLGQLHLGLKPIVHVVTGSRSSLEENLVRANCDFFRRRWRV